MELVADQVGVAGTHDPLLLPTSLAAAPRQVTVVAGDPGYGHVALALALGGRLALSTGSVTLDGSADTQLRRRHVALVDLPEVTSPEPAVKLRAVVAEQLALAGRPAGRAATRAFLAGRRQEDLAPARFETIPPHERTALLLDIAASRAETRVVVLAAPDRLGGDPGYWWRAAQGAAEDGLTVVVQCTHATARHLGQPVHYELGVSA
ncbi:MAG: hypothetical protein ACXVRN_14475 [Solirubrobacteraceae bacterium]